MREWLWQHRAAVIPTVITLVTLGSLLTYRASGNSWTTGLFSTLFNLIWWSGLYYLYARESRKRKSALEKRGLYVYLRYPGSRPGSLQDTWAGGTATCQPSHIVFQEVMDGTDVSLGKPTSLEVLGISTPPQRIGRDKARRLPPGLKVLVLTLPNIAVEIAAEPATLEKLRQKILPDGPAT